MALGNLFVTLKLVANEFNDGIKNSQKEMKELEKAAKPLKQALTDIGTPMVAVGGAVTAAFIGMAVQAANYGDAIRDASIRTGVSTESLSGLKLAAEQTGTSFESVNAGLIKMSKNALAAADGSKQSAKAFEAIGVAVKDASGQLRPMDAILGDVAERFSKMKDGTEKAALAQQIFGRGAVVMTEFLNQGKAGLAAFQTQAEELGLVIGTDAANAADEFNDSLNLLKNAQIGLSNTIGQMVLPALTKLIDFATGAIMAFREFTAAHPGLTRAVFVLAAGITGAGGLLLGLAALLAILPSLAAAFALLTGPIGLVVIAIAGFAAALVVFPKFREVVSDAVKNVIGLFALLGSQLGSIGSALMSLATGQFKAAWDTIKTSGTRSVDAMVSALDGYDSAIKSASSLTDIFKTTTKKTSSVIDDELIPSIEGATSESRKAAEANAKLSNSLRGIERDLVLPISRFNFFKLSVAENNAELAKLKTSIQAILVPAQSMSENFGDLSIAVEGLGKATQRTAETSARMFAARQVDIEKDRKALERATESVKNSAGQIFDDMFIKGENVFSSLANMLKGGALSLGRAIFEDVVGALLGPIKLAFDEFFEGLLEGIGLKKLFGSIGERLGGLLGGGGGGASVVPGAQSIPGIGGGGGGGGGGLAGAASSISPMGLIQAGASIVGPIIGALITRGNAKRTEENTQETRDWLELQTIAWNPLFHEMVSWQKWIAEQVTVLGVHLLPGIEFWGTEIVNAIRDGVSVATAGPVAEPNKAVTSGIDPELPLAMSGPKISGWDLVGKEAIGITFPSMSEPEPRPVTITVSFQEHNTIEIEEANDPEAVRDAVIGGLHTGRDGFLEELVTAMRKAMPGVVTVTT